MYLHSVVPEDLHQRIMAHREKGPALYREVRAFALEVIALEAEFNEHWDPYARSLPGLESDDALWDFYGPCGMESLSVIALLIGLPAKRAGDPHRLGFVVRRERLELVLHDSLSVPRRRTAFVPQRTTS